MTTAARARRCLTAICVPALVWLSACTQQSALCQSVADLQSNVQDVRDVNIADDGVESLTQQLDDVKSSLADVKGQAGETFSPDVTAVQSAVDDLQAVVESVQGGASAGSVAPEAAAALSSLSNAIQSLVATARDQGCDLS